MKRVLLVATAMMALLVAAGSAQAKKPEGTFATKKNACRILVANDAGGYAKFGKCMGRLKKDIAAFRFPADDGSGLLSLDQRCTLFEQGQTDPETGEFFQITYPFVFEEDPSWPFPVLTARNHRECEVTLYTYHTLADTLGPPPGAG